jgi:feruloyl esterase
VPEAFESMFQGQTRSAREWGDLVREASPHRGPWPRVSVWHGSADATVNPMNAGEIVKQWTNVHGLPAKASRKEVVDGHPRRVWTNAVGEDIIEEYILDGLAHGTPLATGNVENAYGAAGPFLLEAGISSSYHIAKFWGLTDKAPRRTRDKAPDEPAKMQAELPASNRAPAGGITGGQVAASNGSPRKNRKATSLVDVSSVISKALKAAGLMK